MHMRRLIVMALRFVALKLLPRLYWLLPLMPAVFFAYLIAVMILLLELEPTSSLLDKFKVPFFTLLLILIAFNLGLILQYGFTLSKLAGDTTTPKLILAYLAATYTILLVLPVAIFLSGRTELGVKSSFTVIGLEAFVGAILVAVAIIASRATALIAVAVPATLTATMLLATAILKSIGAKSALIPLAAPLLTIFHSLFNQPFAVPSSSLTPTFLYTAVYRM